MKTAVAIVGGLGNQLFCLAYALDMHARGYKVEVAPSVTKKQTQHHPHHFSILSQDVENLFDVHQASRLSRVLLRLRILLRAISQKLGMTGLDLGVETRGVISDVSTPGHGVRLVRGYFQSASVSEETIELFRKRLFLKAAVAPLLEASEIVLHYRRGDYLSHRQSIGLLDDGYFIRAAVYARQVTGLSRILIFSDGDAHHLRESLVDQGFKVEIFDDGKVDPLTVLYLMSTSGKVFIASNSSFSWWSAALGKDERLALYPKPWFRDGTLEDMGRNRWEPLRPEWSD